MGIFQTFFAHELYGLLPLVSEKLVLLKDTHG